MIEPVVTFCKIRGWRISAPYWVYWLISRQGIEWWSALMPP